MTASDRRIVALFVNGLVAAVLGWLEIRAARLPKDVR